MKTKVFSILFFLSILSISEIFAEINTAVSIDWLTTQSDIIVKGKVIDVIETRVDLNNTAKLLITVDSVYKGICTDTITVYIGIITPAWDSKKVLNKKIIIFLSNSFESKNTFELLVENIDRFSSIINLEQPDIKVFAGDFRVLKTELEITKYIERVIAKANNIKSAMSYLSITPFSEAWNELYAGSSCYLYVPASLYPEAKDKFY